MESPLAPESNPDTNHRVVIAEPCGLDIEEEDILGARFPQSQDRGRVGPFERCGEGLLPVAMLAGEGLCLNSETTVLLDFGRMNGGGERHLAWSVSLLDICGEENAVFLALAALFGVANARAVEAL